MAISSVSMLFCEINSQYEYMSTTETAPLTIFEVIELLGIPTLSTTCATFSKNVPPSFDKA